MTGWSSFFDDEDNDPIPDYLTVKYNADGSRGAMCGNGIRCVGKYVFEHGLVRKTQLADYAPGETALITGTGFPASGVLTMQVVKLKPNGAPGTRHKPWLAATGPLGELATSWYIDPADSSGTSLRLSADCAGLHAEHVFTDAAVSTDVADSMVSLSPSPVTYGSTTAFTLIVTNTSTLGTPTIGSITVAVPAGMTLTAPPTIAAGAQARERPSWATDSVSDTVDGVLATPLATPLPAQRKWCGWSRTIPWRADG